MKKAYRIQISRYPNRDKAILGDPEELNQAYARIKDGWVNISEMSTKTTPKYFSEEYIRGLNFARVIIPVTGKDVISIELGTQLQTGHLEELVKELGLPFDLKEVRYE